MTIIKLVRSKQGWIEHIFINPESKAVVEAEELINSLANYPVLNESDYYESLYLESLKFWQSLSLKEKIELCKKYNQSIFSARSESIPDNCCIEEYCQSDL